MNGFLAKVGVWRWGGGGGGGEIVFQQTDKHFRHTLI